MLFFQFVMNWKRMFMNVLMISLHPVVPYYRFPIDLQLLCVERKAATFQQVVSDLF